MRVLIVEDDGEKLQAVAQVVREACADAVDIATAGDTAGARKLLRNEAYDVLLLDLVLPARPGEAPRADAGLLLLDEIETRTGYGLPAHIIGITAVEALREASSDRFRAHAIDLLAYDASAVEWREQLGVRIRQAARAQAAVAHANPPFSTHLAIVCALEFPELAQVRRMWSLQEYAVPYDHTTYWRADAVVSGRVLPIVAAACPAMGMAAAAVLATKMIYQFRPRYLAMTGISAGLVKDANLGDVLVADRSWDWGAGKWADADGAKPSFQPAPYQYGLTAEIRSQFARLAMDRAALAAIKDGWPDPIHTHELTLRIGPLASGAAVIASTEIADAVRSQDRKVVGLEMEAYALFAAGAEASGPKPNVIVLKSVVDFANSAKADASRAYGAYTSAQVLRLFLERFT